MNDYKFRAWDKRLKRFYYSTDLPKVDPSVGDTEWSFIQGNIKVMICTSAEKGRGSFWEDVDCEVEQRIGRYEQETYQNDIVRVSAEEPYSNNHLTFNYDWFFVGVVVCPNYEWIAQEPKDFLAFPLRDIANSDTLLEVIGNTHQNPELIEELKK